MKKAALLSLIAICVVLAGCQREEIRAYQAPKDQPSPLPQTPAAPIAATSDGPADLHKPEWTKPASWTEQPAGGMRQASFLSAEKNGERADISVIALGGPAGGMLQNVNRWRGQIALPPLDEAALGGLVTKTQISGAEGTLLDMAGDKPPEGKSKPQRTIAAVTEHEGASWFFKMTGEDSVVAAEKPTFIAFLETVRFH
jgi:hypothetical protein